MVICRISYLYILEYRQISNFIDKYKNKNFSIEKYIYINRKTNIKIKNNIK